jgi:hypothetical protein
MKEAYRLTRKDGAPGIDDVRAADYATNLEANLLDLLDRIKSGRYKAPPVRRTYIPKADGSRAMLIAIPARLVLGQHLGLHCVRLGRAAVHIGPSPKTVVFSNRDTGGPLCPVKNRTVVTAP